MSWLIGYIYTALFHTIAHSLYNVYIVHVLYISVSLSGRNVALYCALYSPLVVFYGTQWQALVHYGKPWSTMASLGPPW